MRGGVERCAQPPATHHVTSIAHRPRDNAQHANACARRFAEQVAGIPGVSLAGPVDANAAFLLAPPDVLAKLRARGWHFYGFIGGASRIMFAWDTDPARVDAFCRDLRECAGESVAPIS